MWNLSKYARFVKTKNSQRTDKSSKYEWEYFDSTNLPLEMTLGDNGHLLISHSNNIMESYNLAMVQKYMRGQSKGDSMIIFYNMQDVSHRFRVKFANKDDKSSIELCIECSKELSKYFPVKVLPIQTDDQPNISTDLEGEVTLSEVANVLTGFDKTSLPKVYKTMATVDGDVSVLLKLCLSDPAFPAFVDQVEKELVNLRSESNL